ncbi:MAG: hypothetical protein C6W56_09865 [Caldibacillus debilis]|nr:hypothetical protein [Bacillaceae bacterium]MBY6272765.1 hypothetical protein [Bacillaceae bacterium]OUM89132.1 MAG: hypothetical protein BAA03_13190 [Caldibacillus debilis]REJ27720.1 MAG: hypothetical protein C6W56_09865 [Caldibacillus debilis]
MKGCPALAFWRFGRGRQDADAAPARSVLALWDGRRTRPSPDFPEGAPPGRALRTPDFPGHKT